VAKTFAAPQIPPTALADAGTGLRLVTQPRLGLAPA
jgi:hypothetical protein